LLRFFRRRPEPRVVSPGEARGIVEQKLRDPNLTSLQRGLLKSIAVQCEAQITPSLLADHQMQKIRDRS